MRQICKFNPDRDIERAMPGLAVDLEQALTEGVIKDTGEIPYHNDIDDPTTITGRVSDVFEAIEAERGLKTNMKNAAAAAKAKKESQTTVSSSTATASE